jgi:hypothetical protein
MNNRKRITESTRLRNSFWLPFAVALIGLYGAAVWLPVGLPVAIDPIEVSVADLSYLSVHAQPVYTGVSDPERYSLLYGPLCYLPYGLALRAFGSTITTLKLAVVLYNCTLILLLWFLFRHLLSRKSTVIAIGLVLCALMMKQMAMFLIRGDVALAVAVAGALLAVSLRRTAWAVGAFSLACAFAIDIKFTAVFYLLVPLYFLCRRQPRLAAWLSNPLTAAFAMLPFALPNMSLRHYLAWLHEASNHPLSLKLFLVNMVFLAILAVPPLVLSPRGILTYFNRHRIIFLLLLFSAAGSALTGSKVGAGRSHLNPTIIVFAYVTGLLWDEQNQAGGLGKLPQYFLMLYALVLCVPAVNQVRSLWSICAMRRPYALAVASDLSSIQSRYRDRAIELGYGNSASKAEPVEAVTNFRTQLVLSGNPVTVDAGALFDMGLSRLPMPASTVAAVSTCRIGTWLIPEGEEPFEVANGYAVDVPKLFPDDHLFSAAFRNAFRTHYKKVDRSKYFDIWECEH